MNTPYRQNVRIEVVKELKATLCEPGLENSPEALRAQRNLANLADPFVVESIRRSSPFYRPSLRERITALICKIAGG